MAESKKINFDDIQTLEVGEMSPAELTVEDDLTEYIQPSNLELLKARYAAVEEDEQIRNEGFEAIKKGGLIKKARPESAVFGYYSSSAAPKDEIRTDVDSPLSKVFDETKTEHDADTVSFGDIELSSDNSTTAEIEADASDPQEKSPLVQSDAPNRYGFDTHTRVIYVDDSADDGIKRNTDDELSAAFNADDSGKKRRRLPWSAKRK